MISRYFNQNYDGGSPDIPLNVGDRYYGQDRTRDFYNHREYGALVASNLLNRPANTIINGLIVTQGAGHTINITAGSGVVNFAVKSPTSWAVLPPPVSTVEIPIMVELPALTNQSITGATTDGATTNYVKVKYAETFTSSRARAKKPGSYNSETISSYTITTNSTAPTSTELQIARFTSDGVTLSLIGNETRGLPTATSQLLGLTSDYTITDTDGIDEYLVSASMQLRTITLPSVANNIGRSISIKSVGNGTVKIIRSGADFINNIRTQELLYSYGDSLELLGTAFGWLITKINSNMFSGIIRRNVWSNKHLGSVEVIYDNSVGSFVLGELVSGSTSTAQGHIIDINDLGGGTGVLTLYDISNSGIFTNNEVLTGASSGNTALVNEPMTNKNIDSDIIHNYNTDLINLKVRFFMHFSDSWTNALEMPMGTDNTEPTNQNGLTLYQNTSNTCKIQSATNSGAYINDSGVPIAQGVQDIWYSFVVMRRM